MPTDHAKQTRKSNDIVRVKVNDITNNAWCTFRTYKTHWKRSRKQDMMIVVLHTQLQNTTEQFSHNKPTYQHVHMLITTLHDSSVLYLHTIHVPACT